MRIIDIKEEHNNYIITFLMILFFLLYLIAMYL